MFDMMINQADMDAIRTEGVKISYPMETRLWDGCTPFQGLFTG